MPRLPTPVIEKVVVLSYENEEVEKKKKEFFSVLRKAIVKRHMAETSKNEQITGE